MIKGEYDCFRQLIFLNVSKRANFVSRVACSEHEIHDVAPTDCARTRRRDGECGAMSLVSSSSEDGGWWDTWKRLFREEVPVSIEVRAHSQSQTGSQVGQDTPTRCI